MLSGAAYHASNSWQLFSRCVPIADNVQFLCQAAVSLPACKGIHVSMLLEFKHGCKQHCVSPVPQWSILVTLQLIEAPLAMIKPTLMQACLCHAVLL